MDYNIVRMELPR